MIALAPRAAISWWRGIDRTLLFVVLALIATGLMLSMAASPAAADRLGIDDPFYFLYRQGIFATLSLMSVLVMR